MFKLHDYIKSNVALKTKWGKANKWILPNGKVSTGLPYLASLKTLNIRTRINMPKIVVIIISKY